LREKGAFILVVENREAIRRGALADESGAADDHQASERGALAAGGFPHGRKLKSKRFLKIAPVDEAPGLS
jgi:hypothetical protein